MRLIVIFGALIMLPILCIAIECGNNLNKDVLDSCFTEQLAQRDKILNRSYNKLRSKLSSEQKIALKDAQVAWLKYRDNDCDVEASSLEGPGAYHTAYLACMVDLTNQRIERINYLLIQF